MSQLELFASSNGWPETHILVSLMPQYAAAVVRGEKPYEYRRGQFFDGPATAFVYATTPKSKADKGLPSSQLVAVMRLGHPIVGLEQVIQLKEQEQPGSREMMLDWLKGFTTASAHPIEAVYPLSQPIPLATIRESHPRFQPPQRYLVLNRNPELLAYLRGVSGVFG